MIFSTQTALHRYGPASSQFGYLTLPLESPPHRVVVLLHGGFWHLPWGADLMFQAARDLAGRGFAVWNLEYRRIGEPGGGWPGTFDDVLAGFDALAGLEDAGRLDLRTVAAAGHSAGGQLALWLAGERGRSYGGPVEVTRVAALAAVTDLRAAWEEDVGSQAVEVLLGGPPHRHPGRYRTCSPIERLPLGVRQLVVHGERDRVVPPEFSEVYAAEAGGAGDEATLLIAPRTAHMDVVNPHRPVWQETADWLGRKAEGAV